MVSIHDDPWSVSWLFHAFRRRNWSRAADYERFAAMKPYRVRLPRVVVWSRRCLLTIVAWRNLCVGDRVARFGNGFVSGLRNSRLASETKESNRIFAAETG